MTAAPSAPNRHAAAFAAAMALSGTIGYVVSGVGLAALDVVFFRCVFATVLLGLYIGFTGEWRGLRVDRGELARALLAGVALVFNWVLLFAAFKRTSITVAISVYYLAPLMVTAAGILLFKERAESRKLAAVGLGFFGVLAIVGVGGTEAGVASSLPGVALAFGAAVLYATLTIVGKGLKRMPPAAVSFLQTATGVLLLAPLASFQTASLDAGSWGRLVVLGVVHTGVLYIVFFRSVRHLPTAAIAVLGFLDPAVAILIDRFVTGQVLTPLQNGGVALIFGAVALSALRRKA